MIEHAHASYDGQVMKAENVGALHAEKQNHLGRPDADSSQAHQLGNDFVVRLVPKALQVKGAVADLLGKFADIVHLAIAHAKGLQRLPVCRKHRIRGDCVKALLHAPPDAGLRLGGNLLADNMVHNRGKKVVVHLALDFPHPRDDFGKRFIFLGKSFHLALSVFKKHPGTPSPFGLFSLPRYSAGCCAFPPPLARQAASPSLWAFS